ncbi:zinc finger, c3HC4 type (RING finger) domain-containing protein [Ditylenchus destructor]|uniref:Zinc finger, c3HC4 type (RING finger) domain-containing protein n=1 Tax=Ditylenchus destructor TaxID=166010 RepID=A0AAD4MET0_9BILA|nr:zinc finger, c3HC4 type (RING finger) domain-containing protein [Ditylenchus destructor]
MIKNNGKLDAELAVLKYKNGISRSRETPKRQISAKVVEPKNFEVFPTKDVKDAENSPMVNDDDAISEGTDYFRCVVCFVATPELMFLPCCHFCICNTCKAVAGNISKCYLCRSSVEKIICPILS